MRTFAVGQRREIAETAVARRGASIAIACRAFGVSETCYRYGPKVRSTTHPLHGSALRAKHESGRGMTSKPSALSERLTI
jgi:hypothetical protein